MQRAPGKPNRGIIQKAMSQNRFPPGWNEARVRRVQEQYERQSEAEAVAEDEAVLEVPTQPSMEVPARELHNRGGQVRERATPGEALSTPRVAPTTAALPLLPQRGLDRATLLARWQHLPPIDPEALRRDLEAVLDAAL